MLVLEPGALTPGSHGSTFGGNALACAAARTVMAVIEQDGLLDAATKNGEHLARGLAAVAAKHPKSCSGERGRGLLRGLVLTGAADVRTLLGAVRDRGVLLTVAGTNVLRFTPPLIVTPAELDEGVAHVDAALTDLGW